MSISFNNLRNINDTNLDPNIYRVTSGGTVYTALAASAVDLWADTGMAVGDYLLWRITNQCNKPRGMRFHVQTAIAAVGFTAVWEYRLSDGTWSSFTGLSDATNTFTTAGTDLDVTWTVPTDWGTNATIIGSYGATLWWRMRITGLTSYTEGGRLGNTTPAVTQIYDNAVRVDSGHYHTQGTATSGNPLTLFDTGKAFTVNSLKWRHIYIHTGTGAGQVRVIRSNTATSIVVFHPWDTNPDATSQYRICANFSDLYDADVAGGWGVITKAGEHSYSFDCYLSIMAGAFGDCLTNVEFIRNYFFYTQEAHTNDYQLHFGWRLPLIYGSDKGVWGNTFIMIRDTPMYTGRCGFGHADSLYVFSAGNRYILRHDLPYVVADGSNRAWFVNRVKYSIDNYFEGWRSVTYPYASTESNSDRIVWGYSGVEQPLAKISKLRSYFNQVLALFITTANNFSFEDFELGPTAYESNTSVYSSPIQFYGYTGSNTKLINLKPRLRPMADVFQNVATGSSFTQSRLNLTVLDEQGNLLPGATVRVSDGLLTNNKQHYYLNFDGADDYVSVANSATANQFSGSTAFSVEAWVRSRTSGEGTAGRFLDKGFNSVGFALYRSVNNYTFSVVTSTGVKNSNTIAVVPSQWAHVVGVWDGATVKLYVNNVTGTGVAATGTATDDSAQGLYFGNNAGNTNTMHGHLRAIRLYRNKALSAGDVSTLFNNGDFVQTTSCPISGCTAEYKFRDGSGTTLTDTYGNNATLGATPPNWFNTSTSLSTQNFTGTTGTEAEFLATTAFTDGGLLSLTNQPSEATKLRLVVTNFRDISSANGANAAFRITGTNRNGDSIVEVVYTGEIGNGIYYTNNEFLTVISSGIFTTGMAGTLIVDRKGMIYPITVDTERWRSTDDITLDASEFNPITIKVSRPGFETAIIKKNLFGPQDLTVALKRSRLRLL